MAKPLCADEDYERLIKPSLQIVDFTTVAIVIIDDDLAEGVDILWTVKHQKFHTKFFRTDYHRNLGR